MNLSPGTRLGPYEIEAGLGAGGMGQVYRARDTRLGRQIAIKLLVGGADAAADRLLEEARNASALNHPNICTLHEIGEAEGTPFIVMELVGGRTLDGEVAGQGLPLNAVLRLGAGIARGLAHAHARGIVHRDLKSANVALTADGQPKILDFGIAKRLSPLEVTEATQSLATLAADHEIAGTLPYMAPEVLEGRPADARSDLWALGVMLVEMASGRRPFRGETGLALSTAILRDPPAVPASMPPGLAEVVRRLLAKDPRSRYQSAEQAVSALEQLVTSGSRAEAPRRARRFAGLVLAAIGLGALAILGAAWLGTAGRGGPAAGHGSIESIAVLPLGNDSNDDSQRYFADGMTEALISHLSAIEDLRVISRTSIMQFRDTTQPLRDIATTLGVDAVVEGAVLPGADSVRITARLIDARTERPVWRGEYERPLGDAIGLQREIAAAIGREIRGELTAADTARLARRTTVDPLALQSYLRGRFHWNLRSAGDLAKAAAVFEDAIRRDPSFAAAHAGLADVYVLLGDFRDMLPAEAYRHARRAVEEALRLDPLLAEAHTTRGWLAFAVDRDWTTAERSFERAVELNPGYATAHQWRGEFLAAMGRFEDALAAAQRATDLDPLALMPQAIHGWIAYMAGRHDEALALFSEVLERDPGFRPARLYRAWSYMDQGRLDDAERETAFVLEGSSSRAVPVATLGRIAARRGDRGAAGRALAELRALPYPPSFDIAKVYAELRNRDEALDWLEVAEREQNSAVLYINVDRAFQWLHGDDRFDKLLRALNLESGA
jgi:eukaryotic-like serine/threonine-protein kinase